MSRVTPVWPRPFALWPAAIGVFAFSWLFRFNDPGGSFAGLTDDHFFYLVRGWQILFGDLPVRDFVDHGAPLYYYVGAAVQAIDRGTLSEVAFSVTALALSAALTFWLAARASGSVALGLVAAAFQILLYPRFYNYPKLLAYATVVPLLWWYADRASLPRLFAAAAAAAVWFLFRHDHGALIGVGVTTTIVLASGMSWTRRIGHLAAFCAMVVLLLLPYLFFIERNGGVYSYFRQASQWAERDRGRAPVEWPGLFDAAGPESAASGVDRLMAVVSDNLTAWLYYTELVIPLLALLLIACSAHGCRGRWPNARVKLAIVAVVGIALDAAFLRSPLEARLADPSVPLAILLAWLARAVPQMLVSGSAFNAAARPYRWLVRTAAGTVAVGVALVIYVALSNDLYRQLERAWLTDGIRQATGRVAGISQSLREEWKLETWLDRADRPELMTLSLYLNACTQPTDRVLVQGYLPQVLALARRAFAGGHADLRPGFFGDEDAQRLTVARLERQSVPVILLDTDASYRNFRTGFPLVMSYIDGHYRLAGTRVFDGRFGINLFVRRDLAPQGSWDPLPWPCYGTGRVGS